MIKLLNKLGTPTYVHDGKDFSENDIMWLAEKAINYEKEYEKIQQQVAEIEKEIEEARL